MTEQQQIKAAFEAALGCPAEDREHLLEQFCAGDAAIRAEVEALLRAHTEADVFLTSSPLSALGAEANVEPLYDFAGRRIGSYELQCELGQGGMATVYLAERIDGEYRQQVALKLVSPHGELDEITRRFKRERQILATLDHPNIARLLDGGTTEDGRPYLVMEYIAGQPITRHCRERNLPLAERLRLFQTVCAAVAYAHRNLVVHRDIKPGNILVTSPAEELSAESNAGKVKLLDFGIAKLLTPDVGEQKTITGLRPLTPHYASPEQLREETITTATDVYSLGVLLYELLTGAHPHDLKDHPLHEVIRLVCEEDPTPPSSRNPQLRGDLDNIVLLALRKDPFQRYQTVEQFSDDISRFLAGKTVNARPATLFYRTGKFARRNKLPLTVMILLLAALLIAGMIFVREQNRQREMERQQRYTQLVRLAGQDLENGEGLNLRALANRYAALPGKTDVRGFEWDYLRQAGRKHLATLSHPEWVCDATFSPDGGLLATTFAKTIWLWDTTTLRRVVTIEGHTAPIRDLDFSPDGKLLASIGEDRVVNLWDVTTRTRKQEIKLQGPFFGAVVSFSPNGKYLVASSGTAISDNAKVHVWELGEDGTARRELPHRGQTTDWAYAIGFSPDASLMAVPGPLDLVILRETATGKVRNTFRSGLRDVHATVFSDDGKLLVLGCYEDAAKILNSRTGGELHTLIGHKSSVYSLAFTPNQQELVTGSSDRTAKLWNVATGVELATFSGHANEVLGVCISPDGRIMATSSNDGTVRLWDLSTPYAPAVLRSKSGKIRALSWLPGSQQLLSAGEGGGIKLWDVLAGVAREALPHQITSLHGISLSSDGQNLAVNRANQEVELWDLPGQRAIHTLRAHSAMVQDPAYTPDGQRLAIASEDGSVGLWETSTGTLLRSWQTLHGNLTCLAISPDGRRLATGGNDHNLRLWDVQTGQLLMHLTGHNATIQAVCFSADGTRIVTASADRTAMLWEIRTGARLQTLSGHVDEVTCVTFSPDGKRIATGSLDKTIRLWNAVTGEDLLIFRENLTPISALSFSPDGQILTSGAWDGTIRFWRAGLQAQDK